MININKTIDEHYLFLIKEIFMKKLLVFFVVAPILIINACNNSTTNSEKSESNTTTDVSASDPASFQTIDTTKLADGAMYYQCSMDPEVIIDKPGDCPKCGMKLDMKHKK